MQRHACTTGLFLVHRAMLVVTHQQDSFFLSVWLPRLFNARMVVKKAVVVARHCMLSSY